METRFFSLSAITFPWLNLSGFQYTNLPHRQFQNTVFTVIINDTPKKSSVSGENPVQQYIAKNTSVLFSCDSIAVTRVRSQGKIKVRFNIVTRDMKKLGYDCEAATVQHPYVPPGASRAVTTP